VSVATANAERWLVELGQGAARRARPLVFGIATAGCLYGAAMGSFACDSLSRAKLIVYAGVKVPLLLFATTAICLPCFFVLNTLAGLRHAFTRAVRAIFAGQAGVALSLAAQSPLILFLYVSGVDHDAALLANGATFAFATAMGQVVLRAHYRDLIAAHSAHRVMLFAWMCLYTFVGIQMGWLLRPFVGSPDRLVTFFRAEPFSNAYVVVADLVFGWSRATKP
jgi:hypothetical protein